jgi:CHAT domain-containing protein/Tfp pilus assembly protein PilF
VRSLFISKKLIRNVLKISLQYKKNNFASGLKIFYFYFITLTLLQMWSMKRYLSSFLVASPILIIVFILSVSALISCRNHEKAKHQSNSPDIFYERAESLRIKSEYDSSLNYYKLASEAFRKKGDWESVIKSEIGVADYYRIKGQLDEALRKIEDAEILARKKLDTTGISFASLFHKKGIILSDKGDFEQSNILLNKSIALRVKLNGKNDTLLALSYNGLGTNYLYQGQFDKSLDFYQKSIAIAINGNKSEDADFAMFYQNLGIAYASKGDYEKAVQYLLKSLEINKKVLSALDPKLAQIYQNLGRLYEMTDRNEEALDYFNQAEQIYLNKFGNKHQVLASIYHNEGGIYTYQADYEKALNYFNKALTIYRDNLSPTHPNILFVLLNIGYVYEKQSNYTEAIKYYIQSIPPDENSPYIIKSYRNLANLYFQIKNEKEAEKYFKLALDKSQKVLGLKDPEVALCYLYYGDMISLKRPNDLDGLKMFHSALEIYNEVYGSQNRYVSDAYKYIGGYYSRRGNYEKALEFYQKALIAGFPSFKDTSFVSNPEFSKNIPDYYLLDVVNKKADALYALSKRYPSEVDYLTSSNQTYALAVSIIEKLRSSYQSEESKLLISGLEKNAFLNAMKTSMELFRNTRDNHYIDEVLKYAEKSKAAVLLSSMRDMEAKQVGNLPTEMKEEEKSLKVELASYNKFIFEEKQNTKVDQSKIKLWSDKVFEINQKYDSLVKVIEVKYPSYYNLKYNNEVIGLDAIKAHLQSNQALIEYTLTDTLLYTMVIADKQLHVLQTRIDSAFIVSIRKLRDITGSQGNQDFNKANYDQFVNSSYQLYNILIEPVKPYLKNKRLIIIPDAEIGYISFDILLTHRPRPDQTDFRDLPYLIVDNSISYAVSATLLFNDFKKNGKKVERRLLAFAPTYDNIKNVDINVLTNKRSERSVLMPIPGVQKEVENISKIFNSSVFEDKQATEANFKVKAGNYGLLHLAMHTIINDKNPLYSKLVFYQNDDKHNDGLLNTYELFNMDLNAQLAVLSACNTGAGLLQRGEGIMSLARGFFYAGVPSIVMTLWSVEDYSGVELMTSFYSALAEGKTKDEALRQAKLNYLQNSDQLKAHPHFWAAYVNIGDTTPLNMSKRIHNLWLYLVLSVLLITGILFTIIKVRNRRRPLQHM